MLCKSSPVKHSIEQLCTAKATRSPSIRSPGSFPRFLGPEVRVRHHRHLEHQCRRRHSSLGWRPSLPHTTIAITITTVTTIAITITTITITITTASSSVRCGNLEHCIHAQAKPSTQGC